MAETHPENRSRFVEVLDNFFRYSRIARNSRAGGDHNVRRLKRFNFRQRDAVVAEYPKLLAHLAQILHEVVGERIVVIDNDNHNSNPPSARSMARTSARDLFTVSMYSFSGIESATIPPPAWT